MTSPCAITDVTFAMGLTPTRKQPDDWRFGTKFSLSVNPKKDVFYDHEVKAGGNVYAFIIHQGHATDLNGAREWLKSRGLVSDDPVAAFNGKGSGVLREHIY